MGFPLPSGRLTAHLEWARTLDLYVPDQGNNHFAGTHILVPRGGVAVHINAFNFPAWGTFEKVAVSILAGMPVVTKPATATAWLAWRMSQIIVEADIRVYTTTPPLWRPPSRALP